MSTFRTISFIIFNVFYYLFSLAYNIDADELYLISGEISKGKILDTNGCEIKFLRNEYTSTWKKTRLNKIIWNNDTISYIGYACNEKPKLFMKYENTPEFRILAILDNSQKAEQVINENAKIAFLKTQLEGHCTENEFSEVQNPIIDMFTTKSSVSLLSPTELLNEINSTQHKFDYAFIAKKYHNKTVSFQPKNSFLGAEYRSDLRIRVFTLSEFVLFDIKNRIIVFQKSINENRTVWGPNSNTLQEQLTPSGWNENSNVWVPNSNTLLNQLIPSDRKEKMAQKQADRRSKSNARSICNQMQTAIWDYLEL